MQRYIECIDIDRGFEPVFNEDVDIRNKDQWKSFIPHENFNKFLDTFFKALDRGTNEDIKSIWLFGSYGTGKTHAVFVLKHLLEDDDDEVNRYLEKHNKDLPKHLVNKLKALRENEKKVLVVFRSSAGHINSATKLLLEVQQAIYEAYIKYLKKLGLDYQITKTDIQMLRERLDSDVIDWDKLIIKYSSKIPEVSNVEDIKRILDKGDIDFASRLIDILTEEGIFVWGSTINPERLKTWIEEILEDGKISNIVFIWDEFSDFFKPDAPLATLQELAHLTSKIPFYLVIVTHRAPEIFSQIIKEDIGKMKDRFHYVSYSMELTTIYKLISRIIAPKEDCKETLDLIFSLKVNSNFNFQEEIHKLLEKDPGGASYEDLMSVLPIHPYTAYISSKIAEFFGSANRTVFQFLKSNENGSFTTFLKEFPKDNHYLLTVDFLWDYFFIYNDKIRESHPEVIYLINFWNTYSNKLDESERIVLKAVLLLFALSEKILQESLLNPKLSNLKLAFSGTPLYSEIAKILESLESKRVVRLLRTRDNDIEVLRPVQDVDREEIERIKRKLPDFQVFIRNNWGDKLRAHLEFQRRQRTFIITSEEIFRNHIPKMPAKGFEIKVAVVLLEKLERIPDLKSKVVQLSKEHKNVVFAISFAELGSEKWESIRENLAYEEFFTKSNKRMDADYHKKNVENVMQDWINRIKRGEFYIVVNFDYDWNSEFIEGQNVSGIDGFKMFLEEEVLPRAFPYSLDKYIHKDALWHNKNLRKKAVESAVYLQLAKKTTSIRDFYDVFHLEHGILDEDGNFIEIVAESNKDHPLVKIRDFIKEYFQTRSVIDLLGLWDELQNPPFGLDGDSPVGCFAFAVALKDFAIGCFAINDKGIEKEVTKDGLIDYVMDTVKGQRWKLQKLSNEQIEFCNLMAELFDLGKGSIKTPKDAVQSLRNELRNEYKYPLWVLKYVKSDMYDDEFKEFVDIFIDLIDKIVKTPIDTENGLAEQKDHINELYKTLQNIGYNTPGQKIRLIQRLKTIFAGGFYIGFENFVSTYSKEALETVSVQKIEEKLRNRLQEEVYYWDEEKVRNILTLINTEVKLISKLSRFLKLGDSVCFVDELIKEVTTKIRDGVLLPLWIGQYHPKSNNEINELISKLNNIILNTSYLEFTQETYDEIEKIAELIDRYEEELKYIFSELNEALRNWLQNRFGEEISDEIERDLIVEVYNYTKRDPKIQESELLGNIRRVQDKLKIKILQNEINKELENIIGTSDIRGFLNERRIPVDLIKYLESFAELQTKKVVDVSSFFKGLLKINQLSETTLREINMQLKFFRNIMSVLLQEGIHREIFKTFFGGEWIEGVFEDKHIDDFINYLINRLGSEIVSWSEVAIKNEFDKWRKEKYRELFYDALKMKISYFDEKSSKELIFKLLEDPAIGLKIAKYLGVKKL